MNRGKNPLFESPITRQTNNGRMTSGIVNPRATATQPTYDFLTGGAPSPPQPPRSQPQHAAPAAVSGPAASSSSQSQYRKSLIVSGSMINNNNNNAPKIDYSNEGLRSELESLRYELQTIKSDRELERIRYQEEVRAAEVKAEEKAKLADAAETDKRFLFEKQKSLGEELGKVKEGAERQKHDHERTIRQLRAQVSELEETADERLEDLHTLERQSKRQIEELETRNKSLSSSLDLLQKEYDEIISSFQETQQRCSSQEVDIENLRNEIVRLEGASGDLESLQVLKRELSQQLAQVKTLETTNKKLTEEAKRLRDVGKNVEVLEEQKISLEGKLRLMDTLREELSERELQLTILKDEKKAWSAFLEDNEGILRGFNSPQDIARALMEEKVEKAELIERLGRVEPELAEREEAIERAEKEREHVKQELEKVLESYKKLLTSRARIERNRELALKEVGMLREQLKSYSTEESNLMGGNYDSQKTKHIEQLESLIQTYKRENQNLLSDISKREKEIPSNPPDSLKRAHEAISSTPSESHLNATETAEKLGQLTRRARHYQEEVTKLKKSEALLRKELKAAMSRISALEESSVARQRILELKDNPTAKAEAVKLSQLRTLQAENEALLVQLKTKHESGGALSGKGGPLLVPVASLDALTHQLDGLKQQVAEREKRMARLKQIWLQKSVEWRQAVHSIVGILFDFMPNGRVRVSSREWYVDQSAPARGATKEAREELDLVGEEDPGIIFDGEQGTMKISPDGFRLQVAPLVKEWVEEKGDIPGLIAALNMERYNCSRGDEQGRMEE